jgi:nicotinate-nucleotide--dimethylbenzimidazole phosphoribosyltransferase
MIEKLFTANQSLSEKAMESFYAEPSPLTMTEGALGRIEEMAVRLAGHQGNAHPAITKPWVTIFAADHGIAKEEVSDYPPAMTVKWVEQFCQGKAATSVLANFSNIQTELVDVGVDGDLPEYSQCQQEKVARGTASFNQQAAMTQEQLIQALEIGIKAAERAKESGADLFIGGDIGVANTSSAIAMIAVLSGKEPLELVSMGRNRVMRSHREKAALLEQAITLHREQLSSPLRILQHLGGFEIAALCGAYMRCAQLGLTIVVDGLMATVAAWIADLVSRNDQLVECESVDMLMDLGRFSVPETLFCICGTCPRLLEWCFFSHQSAEAVHKLVLEILAVDPMLQFDMKWGQASAAVMVIPLLQQACLLHTRYDI